MINYLCTTLGCGRRSSWTGSSPIVRSSSPSSCASSPHVARALDERSAEVGPTRISNSMPSPHLWRKASMAPGSLANPHRQHPIGPSSTHDRRAGIEREDHTIDLVGRARHCEHVVEPQGVLPSARSRCDNACWAIPGRCATRWTVRSSSVHQRAELRGSGPSRRLVRADQGRAPQGGTALSAGSGARDSTTPGGRAPHQES